MNKSFHVSLPIVTMTGLNGNDGNALGELTNEVIRNCSHSFVPHDDPNHDEVSASRCCGHGNEQNGPD